MHPRQMRETVIPVLPSFEYCMISPRCGLICGCMSANQNSGASERLSRSKRQGLDSRKGSFVPSKIPFGRFHPRIQKAEAVRDSGRGRLGDGEMKRLNVVAVIVKVIGVHLREQDGVDQYRDEDDDQKYVAVPGWLAGGGLDLARFVLQVHKYY